MLIAAHMWSAAVPAAAQLLQRSELHLDLSPQPPPEVCYELLAQVRWRHGTQPAGVHSRHNLTHRGAHHWQHLHRSTGAGAGMQAGQCTRVAWPNPWVGVRQALEGAAELDKACHVSQQCLNFLQVPFASTLVHCWRPAGHGRQL